MNMKKFARRHWLQDFEKFLLVGFEQEELSPKSLGGSRIFKRVIIGKDVEKMKIELHNLGLEGIWPQLLGKRGVHLG